VITECGFFAYLTIFWQCSTKGYEVLLQGNFANHNTNGWMDFGSSRRNIIRLNLIATCD